MAYKKKYGKKKFSPKRKSTARKGAFKKSVMKIAKQAVMKKAEPKQRSFAINGGGLPIQPISIYHQSPILENIFRTTAMPVQGVTDYQRIGDRINITHIEFRWVLGQSADRPNVNWRWWIFKVPKGTAYTYAGFFNNITGNVMLDDLNKDTCTIVKQGKFQMNRGSLNQNGTDELTTTKKITLSFKRGVKFGPGDAAISHNLDDYYFMWACYDAYGTLTSDKLGYYMGTQTIYYRDP